LCLLLTFGVENDQDESVITVELDSSVGPVSVTFRMPPDYPHVLPEMSIVCASHKLVISDALKALQKEVTYSLNQKGKISFHFFCS